MAYKKNPGIYLITNTVNGMLYIGSSNSMQRRWAEHRSHLSRGIHANDYLQKAWNKYGAEAFEFTELELCSEDVLLEREDYWLNFYSCTDRSKGYNISDAQRTEMTEETRAKLSAAHKGKVLSEETKRKLSEINTGRRFNLSEEAKQKISKGKKGKKFSDEHKKNLSKANKGKTYTEKQRLAHIGKHKNKLTYEQAVEIRALKAAGKMYKEIAPMFGVSERTVFDIVKYKYHREKGE